MNLLSLKLEVTSLALLQPKISSSLEILLLCILYLLGLYQESERGLIMSRHCIWPKHAKKYCKTLNISHNPLKCVLLYTLCFCTFLHCSVSISNDKIVIYCSFLDVFCLTLQWHVLSSSFMYSLHLWVRRHFYGYLRPHQSETLL